MNHFTSTFVVASTKAKSRPIIIASYLVLLLDTRKLRQTNYSICSLVRKDSMSPTPALDVLKALFTCRIHHWPVVSIRTHFWGNSAMKSMRYYIFKDNRGLYYMSYSLNSIAHFIIHPDKYSLLELLLGGPRSMDGVFSKQCAIPTLSVPLENSGFQHLPKLYSHSKLVLAHCSQHVRIGRR